MDGCQSLRSGDNQLVVCGGQENMSRAPHTLTLRAGVKMGNATMVDSMNNDGLTDAFLDCHMGVTGGRDVVIESFNYDGQIFVYDLNISFCTSNM